MGGATGPRCIFFLQICNEVHGRKKMKGGPVPPTGDRGLSPTPGATGSLPLYKPWPPFPCHLSLKIQEKERGEEKKSGEALPNSALVIYR